MKKHGVIAAAVAVLDQLIKLYVRGVPQGIVFFEVRGLFSLEHCVNTGAAFSAFSGYTLSLALASILLLAAIVVYAARKLRLKPFSWAVLECLIGGGVGNLLDRLLFAGVTDYIRLQFIRFPVFNLADIVITVSIGILAFMLLTDTLEEGAEDKGGSER